MKRENIVNAIIIMCIVALVAFFCFNKVIQKNNEKEYAERIDKQQMLAAQEREKHAIVLEGGSVKTFDRLPEAQVLLSPEECLKYADSDAYDKRDFRINYSMRAGIDDNLLLYFEAFAHTSCNEIKVTVTSLNKETEISYYVQTQLHGYYMPIKNFPHISSISLSITEGSGGITVKNVQVLNVFEEKIPNIYHGTVNLSEECENIVIRNMEGIPVSNSQDIICDEKYAYIGTMNEVYIASLENPEKPEIVSSVKDLGTVRRLELSTNGRTLFVASREYGVFLIDITDAENPEIISHIDTLELASGVDAVGNYIFIASRYYGIEIYDVTDPKNPKFCSSVKSNNESECIDCKVYGDYLYAGVWATRRIEIFDISDISRPEYLNYVETDGNAYGLDIYEDKLIVSTGFHAAINPYLATDDYGYGTGNGISIYSLKSPEYPKLMSTAKSDNRYYYIGMDYWNVRVSNGFAYLSDLYNGLYVYDIRDGYNPKRIAKVVIPIGANEEGYVDMSGKYNVYGFEPIEEVYSPVTGAGFINGYIYVANTLGDVYPVKLEQAAREAGEEYSFNNSQSYCYDDDRFENGYASVENYRIEGQTYAIDNYGDYLYAGTSYGIAIFDKDLNRLGFYETEHAVRDLQIVNGKIYTAEGLNGVSIYQINGADLSLLANYVPREANRSNVCSQLGVSPDGRYVVVSCRLNLTIMLDVSDLTNIYPAKFLSAGAVYYRNIADGYVNNAIYISHGSGVSEIVFDNEGGYTYKESNNTKYFYSSAGFAAFDDKHILAICNRGYQILNVANGFENVKENDLVYLGMDYMLKGSPSINNNILCVAYPAGGQITVIDITSPANPSIKANYTIGGCPDTAYISEDKVVYVPCRYEGIKKITLY